LDGRDPVVNYGAIRDELERFDQRLGERPEIVAVTKADLPEAAAIREQLAAELGRPVLLVSAVTGQGLNELIAAVVRSLKEEG
jgi:GTP-binding protein